MASHRRRPWPSVVITTVTLLLCALTARATSHASERALVDRSGLEFVSREAFCSLHCKPWRDRNRELSECDAVLCASHRRRLAEEASPSKLSVLSCGEPSFAGHWSFDIDATATSVEAFHGLHAAFFEAFDKLIAGENASYQACQLQWLQQQVLPNATADNATSTSTTGARPTLVKVDPKADQRACVAQIKAIWTSDDESVTPFLSRVDQTTASATVLLVHVNGSVAEQLSALTCVESVTELPSILKLLPLARSAAQINSGTATPKMWVRILEGASPVTVYSRLQTKLQAMYGVTNVYEMPERADLFPRGIFIKAVEQLELWSHAIALAVADGDVEWVDAKSEVSLHGLRKASGEHVPHRRLDDYVADLVGVTQVQQRGINGDDVVVGITDTGLYIDHDQFDQASRSMYDRVDRTARKVIYYNTWADQYDQGESITCGHGTHVSGILVGSSFSGNSRNFGVAPNAKIAFMDIASQPSSCAGQRGCEVDLATPGEASQLLQSQINAGARIFSFSWGTGGSDYSSQARDLDAFVYQNPEILIVIAAGNNGESTTNGQGTISSPAGAKNAITVGASLNSAQSFGSFACSVYNPGSVASFSSAGPTTDGRIKPDVVAPGMALVSSRSEAPGSTEKTSQTCSLQGTSMATPVVGGIAVLLYQWLRDGYWKTGTADPQYAMATIPAALLKALIIHSGGSLQRRLARVSSGQATCGTLQSSAIGLSYPDAYQGYGKPNVSSVTDSSNLYFLPNSTAGSEPSVAHGREVRISFTVPRGVDLRATLVWTDPAGSIRATAVLQHDLDLSVQIRNTTAVFYPLTADNATNRDEKNNVEMVQVSYQQLLDAVNARGNASSLLGPSGEIVVDAIVFGRSVLLARSQAFAFVASSSVIGTSSGSSGSNTQADDDNGANGETGGGGGGWGSRFNNWNSGSSWSAWTIAGVAIGVLLLVVFIVSCVCCRKRRTTRRNDGSAYHLYSSPVIGNRPSIGACPYCSFTAADHVVMVNHVENMHPDGGVAFAGSAQGGPAYDPFNPQVSGNRLSFGTCPYCSFSSADPVVMVNHVENLHPSGGVVLNGPAAGSFGVPLTGAPGLTSVGQAFPPMQYPVDQDHQHTYATSTPQLRAQSDHRCPFCAYESPDPVVLVNHVENLHRGQRMV